MSHVWLKHAETGGYWQCPDDEAVIGWHKARGWEPSDPPEQDDSHLYDKPPAKPEPSRKAAARGKSEKE